MFLGALFLVETHTHKKMRNLNEKWKQIANRWVILSLTYKGEDEQKRRKKSTVIKNLWCRGYRPFDGNNDSRFYLCLFCALTKSKMTHNWQCVDSFECKTTSREDLQNRPKLMSAVLNFIPMFTLNVKYLFLLLLIFHNVCMYAWKQQNKFKYYSKNC